MDKEFDPNFPLYCSECGKYWNFRNNPGIIDELLLMACSPCLFGEETGDTEYRDDLVDGWF